MRANTSNHDDAVLQKQLLLIYLFIDLKTKYNIEFPIALNTFINIVLSYLTFGFLAMQVAPTTIQTGAIFKLFNQVLRIVLQYTHTHIKLTD